MKFGRIVAVCVFLISVPILAGCGANGGGGRGGDTAPEVGGGQASTMVEDTAVEDTAGSGDVVETITVREAEFTLDPADITVDEPGVYVFRGENIGATIHGLAITGPGVEEMTDIVEPGQSVDLRVDLEAGEYEIYCPVDGHRQQGQEGTLAVGQGSSALRDAPDHTKSG